MGESKRRQSALGDKYGQEENILPWLPITKSQASQAYKLTTRGAWIGIGVLAGIWLVIRPKYVIFIEKTFTNIKKIKLIYSRNILRYYFNKLTKLILHKLFHKIDRLIVQGSLVFLIL